MHSRQTTIDIPFQIYNIRILSIFIWFVFFCYRCYLGLFFLSYFFRICECCWIIHYENGNENSMDDLLCFAKRLVWLPHTLSDLWNDDESYFHDKASTFSSTIVNQDIVYTELNLYYTSIKWIPYIITYSCRLPHSRTPALQILKFRTSTLSFACKQNNNNKISVFLSTVNFLVILPWTIKCTTGTLVLEFLWFQ